jgi:hypothetical protein
MSPGQTRNFVIGVVVEATASVARAEQLAQLSVAGDVQREENHRTQAELIGSARILLDATNQFLSVVRPVGGGSAGLGEPLTATAMVIIAVAVIIVGSIALTLLALCYDATMRNIRARGSADRICERAEGGCTAEQYSRIVRELGVGPLDRLAEGAAAATEEVGGKVALTVTLVGAGIVGLGALWFLFGTAAGQRTLKGIKAR